MFSLYFKEWFEQLLNLHCTLYQKWISNWSLNLIYGVWLFSFRCPCLGTSCFVLFSDIRILLATTNFTNQNFRTAIALAPWIHHERPISTPISWHCVHWKFKTNNLTPDEHPWLYSYTYKHDHWRCWQPNLAGISRGLSR